MKLHRVRFTARRMMVAGAVAALLLTSSRLFPPLMMAELHRESEQEYRTAARERKHLPGLCYLTYMVPPTKAEIESHWRQAALHSQAKVRYFQACWLDALALGGVTAVLVAVGWRSRWSL
jgi:hypothetical protein